jgi:hypothetical protein
VLGAPSGSLTKAAFLSARNDVLANVAIVAAGLVTAYTFSIWPDLIVGLGIAVINVDGPERSGSSKTGTPHRPSLKSNDSGSGNIARLALPKMMVGCASPAAEFLNH